MGDYDRNPGRRLVAMFACMYYAAMRPAEAVNIRKADCELPLTGWGRIYVTRTTPEVGKRYTDSGELHDEKGLKHRPDDEVRPVPIPPELVAILRWHLEEFGTAPDGRLFRQPGGGVVGSSTYTRAWRSARVLAPTPDQAASPLAARPTPCRRVTVAERWRTGYHRRCVALGIRWRYSFASTSTASTATANRRIGDALSSALPSRSDRPSRHRILRGQNS